MSDNNKMVCAVQLKGSLLGYPGEIYVDSNKNVLGILSLKEQTLKNVLAVFPRNAADLLHPYVKELGTPKAEIKAGYVRGDWIIRVCSDDLLFEFLNKKQGAQVHFAYSVDQLKRISENNKRIIERMAELFGIQTLNFLYRSNNDIDVQITGQNGMEERVFIPATIKEPILLYADIWLSKDYLLFRALKDFFNVESVRLYFACGESSFAVYLAVDNDYWTGRDSAIRFEEWLMGIEVKSGELRFSLSCLMMLNIDDMEGYFFRIRSELSLDSFMLSASSAKDSCLKIPNLPVAITDTALAIGINGMGFSVGAMTGVIVRDLYMYGALFLNGLPEMPVVDMVSAAMSELSMSTLATNLLDMDCEAFSDGNLVSICPFSIANESKTIDTTDKNTIVRSINDIIVKHDERLVLSVEETGVRESLGDDKAYHVFDKKRSIHYMVDAKRKLLFSPQLYLSRKDFTVGDYSFAKGVFFCGELQLFGFGVKLMFSMRENDGIIGFAKLSDVHFGLLEITASQKSSKEENPVIKDTSSILYLLCGEKNDSAVIFMDAGRDKFSIYIDGRVRIGNLFEFDTFFVCDGQHFYLYNHIELFGIESSFSLSAEYDTFMSGSFAIQIDMNAEKFLQFMKNTIGAIKELIDEFNQTIADNKKKIHEARAIVSGIRSDIKEYEKRIADCLERIKKAKWWKKVYVSIEQGAKIVAYEVAIAALEIALHTALGVLKLAEEALDVIKNATDVFLDAVVNTIDAILTIFTFSKLFFSLNVNRSNISIHGIIEGTVLGKRIKLEKEIEVGAFTKEKVLPLFDGLLYNAIKNSPHVAIEEQAWTEGELSNELRQSYEDTVRHIILYGELVDDIQTVYKDNMADYRPEYACLSEVFCSATAESISAVYEADKGINKDSIDIIVASLERERYLLGENDVRRDDINRILDEYYKETEPAINLIREKAEEMKMVELRREKLRSGQNKSLYDSKLSNEMPAEPASRDYDMMFNSIKRVIEKKFENEQDTTAFNPLLERQFSIMFEEARKSAGCAYNSRLIEEAREEFKKHGGFLRAPQSKYNERFQFSWESLTGETL